MHDYQAQWTTCPFAHPHRYGDCTLHVHCFHGLSGYTGDICGSIVSNCSAHPRIVAPMARRSGSAAASPGEQG